MHDPMSTLPRDLVDQVLVRLGLSPAPPISPEGLRTFYRAWCRGVPFDNLRKMIALRIGAPCPLPGLEAREFFEQWLEHGCGGTCWPTSNALFALARALGFEARRIAGSMGDTGAVSHGSVKVRLEGTDWLTDSSMLTEVPLPLSQDVFIHHGPVLAAETEPAGRTHLVWAEIPPFPGYLPCRLLLDPADAALYAERYEASRMRSPFNQRLHVRRNHPDAVVVFSGDTRFCKTAAGLTSRSLSPAEVRQALRAEIGFSEPLIEEWVRRGCLEASFQAPDPPPGPPPPVAGLPPSQRALG
jgi:N-hydroxyarylamine O-acetyltransferase